jgi:capsular polysaccharide transport system permease protein
MAGIRRSPAQITYTTWSALFLRTALFRLAASRFAWFWMVAAPIAQISLLIAVFTYLRVRHIGGISIALWVMVGVLTFNIFRGTASSAMAALRGTRPLYTNPQIVPFDIVIVTAALEGFVMTVVFILLFMGASLLDFDLTPADPLGVLEALFGVWLFGVGFGLIGSVFSTVLPPVAAAMSFLLRPLWFVSGVIFPVTQLPYPARGWFLWNPLVHGLESARRGFAPYYHIPAEVNLPYLYAWAGAAIFLGLALHVRYSRRLVKQ